MTFDDVFFVDADKLRIGLFVELDVGWMAHPFPTGSFKLVSVLQIEAIQALKVKRVRCIRSKSDPESNLSATPFGSASPDSADVYDPVKEERKLAALQAQEERRRRTELLSAQDRSLTICERRFGEAGHADEQAMSAGKKD